MLKYAYKQIPEELQGAVDYMEKAIEHKGTPCGEKLYGMAMDELKHANNLLTIFRKSERPKTLQDADYAEMQKKILDTYADQMQKLEAMKTLYWKV